MVGRTEHVKAASLVLFDNILGDFRCGCRTNNCRKSRGGAVNKFDAPFSQNGVVRRTHPDFTGIDVRVLFRQVEIRLFKNPQSFYYLVGEDGGHAGVQQGSQIRQVVFPFDMGGQQAPGECQGFFEVFQGFHFHSGEGIDHRKVVGGVGETDFSVGVIGIKCLFETAFSGGNHFVPTLNGCKCD